MVTGASQRESSSSSSRSRVSEQPAISREVTYGPTSERGHGQAAGRQDAGDFPVHQVNFDQWGAAHPVQEGEHGVAAPQWQVRDHRFDQQFGDFGGGRVRLAAAARLAVDADADLHFVVRQLESRPAGGRNRAGGQSHPQAAPVFVDPAGDRGHFGERAALFGAGSGDLFHQYGHSDAPPARGVEAVLDGDVVVRTNGLDLDFVARAGKRGGQLAGHLEVQHVTGVVLHDVQDAGAVVDLLGGDQHLVWYG